MKGLTNDDLAAILVDFHDRHKRQLYNIYFELRAQCCKKQKTPWTTKKIQKLVDDNKHRWTTPLFNAYWNLGVDGGPMFYRSSWESWLVCALLIAVEVTKDMRAYDIKSVTEMIDELARHEAKGSLPGAITWQFTLRLEHSVGIDAEKVRGLLAGRS